MGAPLLSYEVSAADDVRRVSPGWDAFAQGAGAPGACAAQVLGRPLWDFVAGASTRIWLERLFHQVRRTGDAVQVPCRCDGGGVDRLHLMQVVPGVSGSLSICHFPLREKLLRVAPLPPLPAGDWTVCSLCGAASSCGGYWHAPGRWRATPGLRESRYVVCPDCRREVD